MHVTLSNANMGTNGQLPWCLGKTVFFANFR